MKFSFDGRHLRIVRGRARQVLQARDASEAIRLLLGPDQPTRARRLRELLQTERMLARTTNPEDAALPESPLPGGVAIRDEIARRAPSLSVAARALAIQRVRRRLVVAGLPVGKQRSAKSWVITARPADIAGHFAVP